MKQLDILKANQVIVRFSGQRSFTRSQYIVYRHLLMFLHGNIQFYGTENTKSKEFQLDVIKIIIDDFKPNRLLHNWTFELKFIRD